MYYAIGASVPSLHRESTNSLILQCKKHCAKFDELYIQALVKQPHIVCIAET